MEKTYINAEQLLQDSFELGMNIYESGYRPDFIVGVWRGGTPIGIAVQEILELLGVESDHIAIRTSSYTGIGERSRQVSVHGLRYLVRNLNSEDSLLIVDDVHDTGLSIQQIIQDLQEKCRKNMPEVKIATPYYKPSNNKTARIPDFFIHQTEDWLVFPHELKGLSLDEIMTNKPAMQAMQQRLEQHLSNLS